MEIAEVMKEAEPEAWDRVGPRQSRKSEAVVKNPLRSCHSFLADQM